MIKFTDTYVQTISRGLLEPGEQFIAAGAGTQQSLLSFNIPFFAHHFLLIATNQRLIAIDHRRGLFFERMDRVDSYAWQQLSEVKVKGIFKKKLVVKDASSKTVVNMKLPPWLLNPLKGNKQSIATIVQTHQQAASLPQGAAAPAALPQSVPPQAAYPQQMQAPQSMQPQAYAQPVYGQPQ